MKKLLDRQRKQVKETQELIRNLDDGILTGDYQSLSTNITETNAPSIAASLLSGFDYGFVSRSEGCRFENVNDMNK